MAKFKKNDLITDGRTIWWITGVTDTHYIFTEQDQTTISRPIEDINANFNLWQSKQVWHKPSEEPEDGAEVLFVWKAITQSYHAVGSYNKKEKRVTSLEVTWLLSKIERWADMRDIDVL